MRVFYGLALVLAATGVSGCVSNTLNGLSNLSTSCTTSATSVNCVAPTGTGTGTGSTGATTTTTTGTTTTTTPTVNTGNTTTLATGDTTIILEGSTVQSLVGKPVGLSKLKDSPLNHTYATLSAIPGITPAQLAAGLTADQQILFDTKTANNPNWPVSKTMAYNDYGTCINDNGALASAPGQCILNPPPAPVTPGTGGHGLGGEYKLYRYLQTGLDEELQIWTWNQSYATQYRDVTASGTDPQHQAWSFGGNYTAAANVPTSGPPVNYFGRWGATAKTTNFKDQSITRVVAGTPTAFSQTVHSSNNWRVNGISALTADFATGKFTGTLRSQIWNGLDINGGLTDVNVPNAVANNTACVNDTAACDPGTVAGLPVFQNWINWTSAFMNADIKLAGTITTDATNAAKPNQIIGTASIDPLAGWTTTNGTNPMYGGFFGATAQEVTGAFAVDGILPLPNGGHSPINNDMRGYLQMSGIFNGQ